MVFYDGLVSSVLKVFTFCYNQVEVLRLAGHNDNPWPCAWRGRVMVREALTQPHGKRLVASSKSSCDML